MIGQLLDGRYFVTQRLGSGGFGETYLAEDAKRPGRPVCVLKHLKPASSDPGYVAVARRLFQTEAESLEKLGKHDRIPRLLAYFEENQEFYLVQELIEGHVLAKEFVSKLPWREERVVSLLEDVLPTLAYIHQQGVIHRDIKPDNIIRRSHDQKLVLVDFGTVKQMMTVRSQVSTIIITGTPGYMSSEQACGKPRPNSDIYTLGILAIQALTGLHPSKLQGDAETGELVWQPWATCSRELAIVINRMVRYHFRERYQSAEAVLVELEPLIRRYAQPIIATPPLQSPPNPAAVSASPNGSTPTGHSQTQYGQGYASTSQNPLHSGRIEPAVLPIAVSTATLSPPSTSNSSPTNPSLPSRTTPGSLRSAPPITPTPPAIFATASFAQRRINRRRLRLVVIALLGAAALTTVAIVGSTYWQQYQLAERTLKLALTSYDGGKLNDAIKTVDRIPKNNFNYDRAQNVVQRWKREWHANQTYFKRAEDAIWAGNWREALSQTGRLTTRYWQQKAKPLVAQANEGMASNYFQPSYPYVESVPLPPPRSFLAPLPSMIEPFDPEPPWSFGFPTVPSSNPSPQVSPSPASITDPPVVDAVPIAPTPAASSPLPSVSVPEQPTPTTE